jgi:hypothetical protein
VRDVALIHFPSCSDAIKPSLQFSCYIVVINPSEGPLFPKDNISQQQVSQVPCRNCKKCPYFTSVLFFSCLSGLLPALLSVLELSTAQAGAREREGCCTFYFPSWPDSNKPSPIFSCTCAVIYASEGSLRFQILIVFFVTIQQKTKISNNNKHTNMPLSSICL